ncbi:response regulator [Herpetosiphon llansteffanensis]|uniref:response regulator n=1 Tax=Herpetosiphon llansteffanensis TaxID=2094568 RepID=UPI000D7C6FEF|nr:response regulator [Herpetosiphon llansteffanensis]
MVGAALRPKPTIVAPTQAKVMVIEDNVDSMNLALLLLRERVQVAYCNARASGDAFFNWLSSPQVQQNPSLGMLDLILLDIRIPRENGYMVLQKLHVLPDFKRTKIVAMSAYNSREDVEKMRLAGFDGFVAKPVSVKTFPDYIERILRGETIWDLY